MRRGFGIAAFVAALIAFGYGAEGNWPGLAVFAAFMVIFGFVWITSPAPK